MNYKILDGYSNYRFYENGKIYNENTNVYIKISTCYDFKLKIKNSLIY